MNYTKAQSVVSEMCQKLHCSELAADLERVDYAREMLEKLQLTEFYDNLHSSTPKATKVNKRFSTSQNISHFFLKTKQRLNNIVPSFTSTDASRTEESIHTIEDNVLPEEECEMEKSTDCNTDLSADAWLGFFSGYEILDENQECVLSENKQCIELSLEMDNTSLESYLRAGIRCFMIDLFVGTELDKQKLIFKLRESELKVSREYGFPITTTLFAMLSPRLQYTGIMDDSNTREKLCKGDKTILTTKLKYSSSSCCNKIYVNARFLIEDCSEGDYVLVGPSIQLIVTEVLDEELKCEVVEPGILSSRLPVRFPAKCSRLSISFEELSDITFAREVGINVLVSYKIISQQYFNQLNEALNLLNCGNLRIFTRLVLNEFESDEDNDLEWIAENYDGFLIDLSARQFVTCCNMDEKNASQIPQILNISQESMNFMTKIYNMKKPIILNPCLIAERQLFVQPHNIPHIFYYPDKFIFSAKKINSAFFFYLLQNALTKEISTTESSKHLFCDTSELGDTSIARACIAASHVSQAKAIVVCSTWPDMSIKLSHFRPKAPIIHVSATKSIADYISLYHHLIFMNFPNRYQHDYIEYVTNAFIFCLIFLKTRQILQDGENVILVYGTETADKLCDNYLVYKFDENQFANNLEQILFI